MLLNFIETLRKLYLYLSWLDLDRKNCICKTKMNNIGLITKKPINFCISLLHKTKILLFLSYEKNKKKKKSKSVNPFLLTKVKIYIELQTCEFKRSSQNNNFIEYTTQAFKSYYSYKNIRDSHLIICISYLKEVFKLHKHTSAF